MRFDERPKDLTKGFVFGTDTLHCDVRLQATIGKGKNIQRNKIGGQHFRITFDDNDRLILKDTSVFGTAVSYDGQAHKQRRDNGFTWILFPGWKIQVHVLEQAFIFELKLATHDICQAEYEASMRSYMADRQAALPPLGTFGFSSYESTAQPSQSCTPKKGPIYIRKQELGSGAFGRVDRFIDVSTGSEYAQKRFYKEEQRLQDWLERICREVRIMEENPHTNIVEVVEFWKTPEPLLVMPYFPLGNLKYQHEEISPVTRDEIKGLLFQTLTALAYLHLRGVAHRDLKPENILVASRTPFEIKLADFGFANDKPDLNTFCGSLPYAAPEIFSSESYTSSVDLWSLGVIVSEYSDGLPEPVSKRYGEYNHASWCHRIVRFTKIWALNKSDGLTDLLAAGMLRIRSEERLSASECLKKGHDVGLFDDCTTDTGSVTPTQQTVWDTEAILDNDSDRAGFRDLEHTSGLLKPSSLDMNSRSYKRQRSPVIHSAQKYSDQGRNKRRQSDISRPVSRIYILADQHTDHENEPAPYGALYEAVLVLLTDLQLEDSSSRGIDDHTCALVEDLCEHFTRLETTRLRLHHNGQSDCVTITAWVNSKEFVLARLTSSERMSSTAALAMRLLHMLQLHNATPEAGCGTEKSSSSLRTSLSHNPEDLGYPDVDGAETQNTLAPRPLSEDHFQVSTLICNPPAEEGLNSEESRRLYDYPEHIKMMVDGIVASIRKVDLWLNATAILTIAGKTKDQRSTILKRISKETRVDVQKPNKWFRLTSSWICYQRGRLLCQELQLMEKLRPLLEYGFKRCSSLSLAQGNMYLRIETGSTSISIRKADFWINAAHILKAAGYYRRELQKFLKMKKPKADQVQIEMKGPPKERGTYVDVSVALEICETYGLRTLKELLQKTLQENGYQNKDLVQQTVSLRSPAISDTAPTVFSSAQFEGLVQHSPESRDTRLSAPKSQHSTLSTTEEHIKASLGPSSPSANADQDPEKEHAAEISTSASFFTEPSYSNGSFLPPTKNSFLLQRIYPNLQPQSSQSGYGLGSLSEGYLNKSEDNGIVSDSA